MDKGLPVMNSKNIRTKEEIRADAQKLVKEVASLIDTMGDTGAPPLAFFAVLDARPDLKERWKKLEAETKEYERKNPTNL